MMKFGLSLLLSAIMVFSIAFFQDDCVSTHFGLFKTWLIGYHSNDYSLIVSHLMINLALLCFIIYPILLKFKFNKQWLWIIGCLIILLIVATNFAFKTNIRLQTLDSKDIVEQSSNIHSIHQGISFFLIKPNRYCEN